MVVVSRHLDFTGQPYGLGGICRRYRVQALAEVGDTLTENVWVGE